MEKDNNLDMDTPSHFFTDCVDFDEPNPYPSPGHDVGEGSAVLSFHPYHDRLALDGVPPSPDARVLGPRFSDWDGFADHFGTMSADSKPLFVDPGLYEGSGNEEVGTQIQVLSMGMSPPSTRRTSSSKSTSHRTSQSESTGTDITPPDHASPSKKRKTRRPKDSGAVEEEHKRSKFLERNRIAASKCREKKKQYVSELEDTKVSLEAQHLQLQQEYNGLLGEVSGLKHHLMAHAKCNDPNIDRWLSNEARRFVQTPNDLFGSSFVQYGQTNQASMSPRSRNPSVASAYHALQGVQFDSIVPTERQGSISYTHGEEEAHSACRVSQLTGPGPSMYASPTDTAFSCLNSPHAKREPDINYNHMPDAMFSPDREAFGN